MIAIVDASLAALRDTVASGEAILFTGAGFSAGMRARDGRPLPTSAEMADDLWRMVFGAGERDGSTLADLFDIALYRAPAEVAAYLRARFTVGDEPPPPHIVAWLAQPWRRIYTLNVDDLEAAVMRVAALPHELRGHSALAGPPGPVGCPDGHCEPPPTVDVIHLNGLAGGDVDQVTFSTLQYAARLCDRQPAYEQLALDLERARFVFVGTTLDEVVLWQHVMSRSARRHGADAPPSFLVARSLTRARAALLEALGLTWLPTTAEDVAAALWTAPATP
jgi:hypothetical protein